MGTNVFKEYTASTFTVKVSKVGIAIDYIKAIHKKHVIEPMMGNG
jgi:hypothetical protein